MTSARPHGRAFSYREIPEGALFYRNDRSIRRLRQQSETMRGISLWPGEKLRATQPAISGWSPAEHLDHSIKVARVMLDQLLDPVPLDPLKPISLLGHAILLSGYIPRGKAKAPKRVRPVTPTVEELLASLDALDGALTRVAEPGWKQPAGPVIPHPYFGGLTTVQTLHFIGVHTNHHLKIVRDIRG